MDNLEPITREEILLDGGDLTPITRKEMFIKRIYDKTQSVPEPITREEYFLNKAGEGSGGDVTIEQLNVTENGTYSESGKAYSPVVVNVPIPPVPENAYLLNSLSGLPADIASFNDGTDLPMASLKVAVTPYQDLHGYDGPWAGGAGKNKLQVTVTTQTVSGVTFTVHDDGTITVSGTATAMIVWNVGTYIITENTAIIYNGISGGGADIYSINCKRNSSYQGDVYSGDSASVEVTSGDVLTYVIVVRSGAIVSFTCKPMIRLASISDATFAPYSNICPIIGWDEAVVTVADDVDNPTVEHEYTIDLNGTRYGGVVDATNGTMDDTLDHIASYNGEALPPAWISDRDVYAVGTTPTIGAEVVYPRATPITVQLAPTPVKSIEGENNISANCGQITEGKYFKRA